jgi:hypothetical protein
MALLSFGLPIASCVTDDGGWDLTVTGFEAATGIEVGWFEADWHDADVFPNVVAALALGVVLAATVAGFLPGRGALRIAWGAGSAGVVIVALGLLEILGGLALRKHRRQIHRRLLCNPTSLRPVRHLAGCLGVRFSRTRFGREPVRIVHDCWRPTSTENSCHH